MNTFTQRLWNLFAALRANLRCVSGFNFPNFFISIFSFISQKIKEITPRRIADAFSQIVIFDHIPDIQALHGNIIKFLHDLGANFMKKSQPLPCNFKMFLLQKFHSFLSIFAPFFLSRNISLGCFQLPFSFRQKARIKNLFAAAERCKCFDADIYSHTQTCLFNRLFFVFTNKNDKPSVDLTVNRAGFDFSFNFAREPESNCSEFGKMKFVADQLKSTLGITKGFKETLSLETGKPTFSPLRNRRKKLSKVLETLNKTS